MIWSILKRLPIAIAAFAFSVAVTYIMFLGIRHFAGSDRLTFIILLCGTTFKWDLLFVRPEKSDL